MGFMSPNLTRSGRMIRFWMGLFFLVAAIVLWFALKPSWPSLLAALGAFLCWFQAFRGWCFFKACRLGSGG